MSRLCSALALVCLAAPAPAYAQELTLTVTAPGSPRRIDCASRGETDCMPLNRASCFDDDRALAVTVDAAAPVPVDSRLLVFLTEDSDCVFSAASELDEPLVVTRFDRSDDPLVDGSDFFFPEDSDQDGYETVASLLDATEACESPFDARTYRLCFVVSETDALADPDELSASVSVLIDTVAPSPPSEYVVQPLDGRVAVTLDSDDEDILRWYVAVREVADEPEPDCRQWVTEPTLFTESDGGTFTVSVDNGVAYELCAYAEDRAGNLGAPSPVSMFSSVDECDFIECYPVELAAGCAAAPAGLWWLGLVLLFGRIRLRLRVQAAVVLILTLAVTAHARAATEPSASLGVRVGAYEPDMTPARPTYELYFGDGPGTLISVDFDRYVWSGLGEGGISLGAGYWSAAGATRVCDGARCTPSQAASDESQAGVDRNRLSVLPLNLGLIYRYSFGPDPDHPIVIPYAKFGLSAVYWRLTVGGDRVDDGWGVNLGVFGTAGVALDLSWLEPGAPNRGFLRGTHVLVEATHLVGNGFDDSRLDLTDSYFQVGLGIDY